jgi:hypothetical protein
MARLRILCLLAAALAGALVPALSSAAPRPDRVPTEAAPPPARPTLGFEPVNEPDLRVVLPDVKHLPVILPELPPAALPAVPAAKKVKKAAAVPPPPLPRVPPTLPPAPRPAAAAAKTEKKAAAAAPTHVPAAHADTLGYADEFRKVSATVQATAPTTAAAPVQHAQPSALGKAWTDCASTCGRSEIYAGAAVAMLRPHYPSNLAFTRVTNQTTDFPHQQGTEVDWDYDVAPSAWIGISGAHGLGLRTGWFSFNHHAPRQTTQITPAEAETTDVLPPDGLLIFDPSNFLAPGFLLGFGGLGVDQITVSNRLNLYHVDLEATWTRRSDRGVMMFSAGGRYLHLSQNYAAELINNTAPPSFEFQSLRADHTFDGGGLTAAWFGRLNLGGSGFAVLANLRGSLLVGHTDRDIAFTRFVDDPTGVVGSVPLIRPTASSSLSTVMPVAEAELAVEYGLRLRRSRPFVRCGVVNHTYFDAGNAAHEEETLSLFGVQAALGVNY